ncbi:aminoacyl-tRNA hydrolase [soil metagenome]
MLTRLFRPNRSNKDRAPNRPVSLIVGLGNPGAKYAATRHNIGFMVVDQLASSTQGSSRERFQAAILETQRDDESLVFVKPLTFMNNSGMAVSQAARWYKASPDRILIIYDDLDLPFGSIRLKPQGSAGGHNGLSSVIDHRGTNAVPRLRIGIGRPVTGTTVNYVLSRFTSTERQELPQIIDLASEVALDWLSNGIESAMNTFNGRSEVS